MFLTPSLSSTLPSTGPLALAVQTTPQVDSLFDLIQSGGPLMIPIALCSILALAFAVERWIRLQPASIGSRKLGQKIADATREGGASAGLEACGARKKPLERILAAGLERSHMAFADREKVVEDVAGGEVRKMSRNLRPLFLVWLIAPLMGLLGTVWGMIEAFSSIAQASGIGRPELLAGGIYRALTTTAAGLTVAIPAIVFYWVLQGRIERFVGFAEETYRDVDAALSGRGGAQAKPAGREESEV